MNDVAYIKSVFTTTSNIDNLKSYTQILINFNRKFNKIDYKIVCLIVI